MRGGVCANFPPLSVLFLLCVCRTLFVDVREVCEDSVINVSFNNNSYVYM